MGTVWRAEDTLLHRPVALKLLAEDLSESPQARRRFLREARALARLRDEVRDRIAAALAGTEVPAVAAAPRQPRSL
jgi:hypothetical protein